VWTCWPLMCLPDGHLGGPFIAPNEHLAIAPFLVKKISILGKTAISMGASDYPMLHWSMPSWIWLPPSFCADGHWNVWCTTGRFGVSTSHCRGVAVGGSQTIRWLDQDRLGFIVKIPRARLLAVRTNGLSGVHRTIRCSPDNCTLKCYFLLFLSVCFQLLGVPSCDLDRHI
jgi:hypothetical protein